MAFVALGVALLVGTFAYLAYDRDDGTGSTGAQAARSSTQAAPGGQEERKRSGAEPEADGPNVAGADPRPVAAKAARSATPEAAQPSAGPEASPTQPPAPAPVQAAASAAPPAVPAYVPLRESHADGVTEVVVGTEVNREEGMRLVASDLASYYPDEGVLLVEFREGANGTASAGRESGFALVFGSREAALAPDLHYTPEEVDEIFEEDGGIRAVSYDDLGEEDPSLRDDLERIRNS